MPYASMSHDPLSSLTAATAIVGIPKICRLFNRLAFSGLLFQAGCFAGLFRSANHFPIPKPTHLIPSSSIHASYLLLACTPAPCFVLEQNDVPPCLQF